MKLVPKPRFQFRPRRAKPSSDAPKESGCGTEVSVVQEAIGWQFGSRRQADDLVEGKGSVPGGASGLQIREGPPAGPWWVRLPVSSASSLFVHVLRRSPAFRHHGTTC